MKSMPKIFVSTDPFGEVDSTPIELLKKSGFEFMINPLKRKLTPEEVGEFARDCHGLIAGTENINVVLQKADHLKMISRVGIGLDSVPLKTCREKRIKVSYTPDAVTMAVVELTIGLMIGLTRHVVKADFRTRKGIWIRLQGKRIGESVIGLIGFGRIGSNVARILKEFHPRQILVNDVKDKSAEIRSIKAKSDIDMVQVTREEIYQRADIISLHLPLTSKTRNVINAEALKLINKNAFLINTSRGGLVNETDLFNVLKNGELAGAAIDTFEQEPYVGPLKDLENIILTQHMGSCSFDCRSQMEIQATQDVIRFFQGKPLLNEVPEEEYQYQAE